MSRDPLLIFCTLTIRKQLPGNGFERSGRGQEPSRGHKFSILENFLSIRDFTSQTLASFPSDLVGVALVGATPLHLLSQTALPLKSPTGAFIAALRFANASLPHGRQSRLIISPAKKNRAFPTGNALLYILLSYVDFSGCVRVGASCFCFAFNFLTHGFRPPACMICYRLVACSVIFRFLPMQAWQGSHRDGWW